MKYVIGTGYYNGSSYDGEGFYRDFWLPNTLKYSKPEKIFVLNSASREIFPHHEIEQWSNLTENPGHAHVKDENGSVKLGGWTQSFIHGALYSYSCGCDYIYKEQDCLAFGDWVDRIYSQVNKNGFKALSGELVGFDKIPELRNELCITFVRHDFIIPMLAEWFQIEKEMSDKGETSRPEGIFTKIKNKNSNIGYFDFGYGGNRPFAIDKCFYIQKPRWFTQTRTENIASCSGIPQQEIDILKSEGLL